jgi:hypothetical protein
VRHSRPNRLVSKFAQAALGIAIALSVSHPVLARHHSSKHKKSTPATNGARQIAIPKQSPVLASDALNALGSSGTIVMNGDHYVPTDIVGHSDTLTINLAPPVFATFSTQFPTLLSAPVQGTYTFSGADVSMYTPSVLQAPTLINYTPPDLSGFLLQFNFPTYISYPSDPGSLTLSGAAFDMIGANYFSGAVVSSGYTSQSTDGLYISYVNVVGNLTASSLDLPATGSIPEPATILLAAFASLWLLCFPRAR